MQREVIPSPDEPPSEKPTLTGAPLPLTADIIRMRKMRQQGWTVKSLARHFERSIEDVERDLGPLL